MKRLLVSDAARADLKSIARYSEREWGKARKKQYLAAIRARFGALRHRPEMARRDIGTGYRSLPIGRHLIFYRIGTDAVVIVRVLHQRMDATVHLTPQGEA
jgi:toxin ParE1/3/4